MRVSPTLARHFSMIDASDAAGVAELQGLHQLGGGQVPLSHRVSDAQSIAPDGYSLDYHFLEQARPQGSEPEAIVGL